MDSKVLAVGILRTLLTTLGQKDPVSEYNRQLWNSGTDKNKEIVRKQKRKLSYYSNIYVVKDPANPHNEDKSSSSNLVRRSLIRSWQQCNLNLKMRILSTPLTSWQGANFKLKIRKVDGYWNYDKSEFDSPGALLDDDDALEALWKKEYSLNALVAQDQFKTYEELRDTS